MKLAKRRKTRQQLMEENAMRMAVREEIANVSKENDDKLKEIEEKERKRELFNSLTPSQKMSLKRYLDKKKGVNWYEKK
jgi:hypothetical protein